MQNSTVRPTSSSTAIHPVRGNPSYLYNRAGLYYFRYCFGKISQQKLGAAEMRISLRTSYRRKALGMARRLYGHLHELLELTPMLTYKELRRRLSILLQMMLLKDHNDLSPREWPALTTEEKADPAFSPANMYRQYAEYLQSLIHDEKELKETAKHVIPHLEKHGFLVPGEACGKNVLQISKAYLQTEITFNRFLEKRAQGDYLAEEPIISADFGELPQHVTIDTIFKNFIGEVIAQKKETTKKLDARPNNPAPQAYKSLAYSEALKLYVQNKIDEKRWKPHSAPDHQIRLNNFLELMGDLPLDEITRDKMREFRDILRKLPPNRTKSKLYKDKSIAEILAMSPERTLNPATINIIVEAVGSLLDWCVTEGFLDRNPAKGLQIKETRQAIELRSAFTMADLQKIFAHKKFVQGRFKQPSYFWVPLIALYTGMRLEEIAQLHCADVTAINSLWVIDINELGKDEDGHGKSLKNMNAKRQVPIHQTLVDLGLIDYHQHVLKQGSIRLFPELKKSLRVGKFGKQIGKQFSDVVNDVLNSPKDKSFHSLRHTFADFYKQRGLQSDIFRQLYGHDIPELAARQYGSKFPPDLLYKEVIEKLDYGLDLERLKLSPYCTKINKYY